MTEQEFARVLRAIAKRQYSWACVLLLRSMGKDPRLYLPYRTYQRLLKENEPEASRDDQEAAAPDER